MILEIRRSITFFFLLFFFLAGAPGFCLALLVIFIAIFFLRSTIRLCFFDGGCLLPLYFPSYTKHSFDGFALSPPLPPSALPLAPSAPKLGKEQSRRLVHVVVRPQ